MTRAVDAVKPDVRDAVRALRRRPGFTATAVAILGLGIGGSAALFSVADRALLRPLPYREAEHLVTVWDTRPADARDHEHPSPGNYLDWSARIAGFESLAAWQDGSGVSTLRSGDVPLVVETVKVTPSFFRVLGAEAERGRTFDDRRERGSVFDATDRFSGGDRVLVMSHGLWSSRFGRDPGVVGRTIMLDGVPWRVLGVMPPGFAMPRRTTQLFLPWDMKASFASVALGPPRDLRFLNVVARLRPGVSRARAQAELEALSAVLADQHPQANAGWSARLVPLREELDRRSRPALLRLAGAMLLVLLLGGANLASLQLARAVPRRREMAIRLSLGASRGRLVRQLVAEGLLLALLGAAAGVLVARVCLSLAVAVAPPALSELAGVSLDGRVLGFTALLSILACVAFGLAPALSTSRTDTAAATRAGGRATATPGARRAWRLLVVGEAALALVLLIGAGLVGRSFLRLVAVDNGFEPQGLVTLRVSLDHASYTYGAPSREFYRELMRRLRALPGVTHAGAVTALPLSPVATDFSRPFWREGEEPPGARAARADVRMATPGYFDALGLTLRSGRGLGDADGERAPRVVVVNSTLARRVFGDQDPLGRRLILDYLGGAYPYEIVGVASDVRFSGPRAAPRAELYIPHAQNPYLDLTVVVRGAGGAAELARRVEREVRAIDPGQPAHAVATMEDLLRRSSSGDRLASTVLGAFAGLALVLTATGTHGLLAFLVAERARELALRQVLGATPGQVGGLVLHESLRLSATGSALGIALAWFLAPAIGPLLFETTSTEPLVWTGALAGLGSISVLAAVLPARAAARLHPGSALRAE